MHRFASDLDRIKEWISGIESKKIVLGEVRWMERWSERSKGGWERGRSKRERGRKGES